MTSSLPCWACGTTRWSHLYDVEVDARTWTYVLCGECGLARLDPPPDPGTALEQFDESYFRAEVADGPTGGYLDYAADAALHRRNGRSRLRRLTAAGLPAGPVLDVGCAHGYFLAEARAAGRVVIGVEPSDHARSEAEALLGQPVHADLAAVPLDAGLAAVTICQVLEHTPDPAATVRDCVERLAPGGLLLVETWDRGSLLARAMGRRWSQVTPPSVVTLLDRPSTRRLLEGAGLQVVSMRASSKAVSVGLVARLVGEKVPRLRRPADAVLGRPGLAGRGIRYALGDVITVVARRT